MAASDTIKKLRAENVELRRALLDALRALEEDGQTVAKRKAVVGTVLKSYPLAEEALVAELAEAEKAKARTRFSVSKAAIGNPSNTFSPKAQGGMPSDIAKRIAKGGRGK
jgi:hypothetical protein